MTVHGRRLGGIPVLATATAFSVLADSIFALALAWSLAATDRLGLLSALLVVSAVVRLSLMPIGGSLADRYSKVLLLRVSAAVRALAMFGVGAALFFDQGSVAVAMMAVLGAASAVHYPADRAIVVELVDDSGLERANGILQTVMNVGNVAGPALAGVLVAVFGGSGAVLMAGVTYVLALATLFALRPRLASNPQSEDKPGIWASTLAGARYALKDRPLIVLLIVIGVMNVGFIGPFAIAMPAHVLDTLGGAPTTLAWLQSGFAVGSVLGAITVASVWKNPGRVALVGSVLTVALGQIAVALTASPLLAVLALSTAGIASGVANVVIVVAIQRRTDKTYIGRVMSLVMLLSMGLAPLSHALTGPLVLATDPWAVILGGGVLIFVGGLLAVPIVAKVMHKNQN